jgi:hypothetical protein
MEVKIDKTKDTEFQNNLNFVRKMKYFTQGVMVIIVIINFYIYESCAIDFVVVFIVPVVRDSANMQSIPLPFIILKTFLIP